MDVMVAQGTTLGEAIRGVGVAEVTCQRRRNEFGGLKLDQVRRFKDLEQERARLRRAVSDLTLDKMILQEAARGTEGPRSETDEPLAPAREGGPGLRGARRLGAPGVAWVLGQPRSTQRRRSRAPDDEARLTAGIVELATIHGRCGGPVDHGFAQAGGVGGEEARPAHPAARGA